MGRAPRLLISAAVAIVVAGASARAQPVPGGEDPHRRRSTLYVAARGSDQVHVFVRDTGETIAAIDTGSRPSGLAARSDGDKIYAACAGSHTLEIIDGATRQILDRVSLTHGAAPEDVVLGPRGEILYVAATGLDLVYAIAADSHQQIGEITVGRRPTRLALSADGRRLFALSVEAGRVDIVDTSNPSRMALAASPLVGTGPSDLALDGRGSLFVVRPMAPMLGVLADGAGQFREVAIDLPAETVAVDRSTGRVILSSPGAARMSIVAPGTGATLKVIPAEEISRVAVDSEGSRLYALSARDDKLLFVNSTLGKVEKEIEVKKEPWDLVLIP